MFVFPKKSLFIFLAFGLLLAFTSCDNEIAQDSILPELEVEEEMPELLNEALPPPPETNGEERRRPCFRFVFPVEIALRNGTIIVASDNEDLREAYRRIRAAGAHANFVYPLEVELNDGDGTIITIERFAALRRLHRACRDMDEEREPCLTINYPIEVIHGDSTFTVNNGAELRRANRAFRPRGVSIVYPIDVTFTESGRVASVNGDRELARLRNFCNSQGDDDDRGESCYRILYPVDLNVNGISVTVLSRTGWRVVARAARRRGADVAIIYPITLLHRESGEEVSIADRDAWEAARELCD